ncbi:MAG: hypothetical protein J6N21_06120, partial [Butyrivibrio sp.]|nr:hypothetical protein [Butyrivibrio sp.]
LIAIVFIAVFLNVESSFAADNIEKAVEAWIYDCKKCGEINTALFPEGADIIVVSADGEESFVNVSHSKEKALRKFAQESSVENGLRKVLDYTESLKSQNLSASPINTGIYELDQINVATDGMRRELVSTMEDKWKKEQEAKAQMAQIAHDLKTPLTVIRGNADLLMEKEYDEESRESLEAIIRNSEKIALSVLDILEK